MSVNIRNISLEWRFEINQRLLFYSSYTLLPFGIILNKILIFFHLRKNYINSNIRCFYIFISLNSIFALTITLVRFIGQIEIYTFEENTEIGCKLVQFFTRIAYSASSWLNFLLTIDRLVFIIFQNKYKILSGKYFVLKLIVCLYLLLSVVNIPNLLYTSLTRVKNDTGQLEFINVCVGSIELNVVRELMSQIIGLYVPFFMMIATNFYLIHKVLQSKKKFKNTKETNFAFSLIISNIIFLISLVPFSIYLFLRLASIMDIDWNKRFVSYEGFMALYETCARIIFCYNLSIGLLVQIFLNRVLRKEFLIMISQLFNLFGVKLKFKTSIESSSSKN
ncbi:unnamed protein product [Brachionus calyciflorus]|uniref:G-protein coupled receptors family 1 profile domain-containing protein n=1 Tax=Brachionus calyciflorus TaxID=104777 RepID=A0A814BYN9_9BILA|nr:unnamed protein product [Brachionus calyciflorus]